MKKLTLLPTIIVVITFSNLFSQITFQKGFSKGDAGQSYHPVQITSDGGYIIVGNADNYDIGLQIDVYLIKTNENGNILWSKTYGDSLLDYGYAVQQTFDGGYIVAGWTISFGAGGRDVYLIKTNSVGDTLWTKTYGGNANDVCYNIQQTTDSGYIFVGATDNFGAGNSDVYLIKTNSNGDTLWTRTYGGSDYEEAYDVQQTTDGGYIIVGQTNSFVSFDSCGFATCSDVYLIKIDENGDTLWTKTYGGGYNDEAYSVQQTNDGGYIISGLSASFGTAFNGDYYLIKTDSSGNLLWSKIYDAGGNDRGYNAQQTTDGGYIFVGYSYSFGGGFNTYAYLIKTDELGDTLWTKIYGGNIGQKAYNVLQTSDGGYIIAGTSFSFGSYPFYLIKTDSNGNSGCFESIPINTLDIINAPTQVAFGGIINSTQTIINNPSGIVSNPLTTDTVICLTTGIIEEIVTNNYIVVYPNPFKNSTTIEFKNEKQEKYTLTIYNTTGALVRKIDNITAGKIKIERENLKSGLYFFQLVNNTKRVGTGKIIIEK